MYRSKAFGIIFGLILSFGAVFGAEKDKALTTKDLKKALNAQERAEINFDILSALELQDKNPKASLELYKKAVR